MGAVLEIIMDICSINSFIILISTVFKFSDQLRTVGMELSPAGPITVPDGATVHINCSVDLLIIPRRTIHWDVAGMRPALKRKIAQKFVTRDTLQIVIQQIRAEDAGPFSCKAENKYGFLLYKNVHIWVQSREVSRCGDRTKFQCKSGQCLNLEKRCDSVIQCSDGSDEIGCDPSCRSGFLCNNRQCLGIDVTCDKDGIDHCGDWSDENCDIIPVRERTPGGGTDVDLSNSWHRTIIFIIVGCILAVVMVVSALVVIMCRHHLVKHDDDTCDSGVDAATDDEIHTLDPAIGSTATVPITGAMDIHPEEQPELQSLIDLPPPYSKHDESLPPRGDDDDAPPPYETFQRGLDDIYNPTVHRSTPLLPRPVYRHRDDGRSSSVDRVLESTPQPPSGSHSLDYRTLTLRRDDIPPPVATSTLRRHPPRSLEGRLVPSAANERRAPTTRMPNQTERRAPSAASSERRASAERRAPSSLADRRAPTTRTPNQSVPAERRAPTTRPSNAATNSGAQRSTTENCPTTLYEISV
ncbi:uncharacterized protein LOC141912633 [Tubulanus polymorphus]|uniref:uncharacterized protein LOC141912633 n=1 Tax=Tubulanus polymorphus TaxID=672921 RepID=UPI003DA31BAA